MKSDMPNDFFPELPMEERLNRWEVVENEMTEIVMSGVRYGKSLSQIGYDLLNYDVNRPFYMRDCTNEDVLMQRGYM